MTKSPIETPTVLEYVDAEDNERRALSILKITGNLRLVGDTGTGKTTFVHYLDAKHKWTGLYEYSLTADTIRADLLGQDIMKDGTTEVRKGIVSMWLEDTRPGPKVLYLDGWNYAAPNVTALMESLGDFRRSVWVPELGRTLTRTPDHWFIISYNPSEKVGYSGTFQSNIAQMRRLECLRIDYLGIREETDLLVKSTGIERALVRRLVEFANRTRTLYKEGRLTTPVTTGNLRNYCAFLKDGLGEEDIGVIVANMFPDAERGTVTRVWAGKKDKDGDA